MPNMKQQGHSSYGALLGILATVISVAAALLLLINRQVVLDQVSVWQYQPSAEITQLADNSGMSNTGKFYFYASHPAVQAAQDFNKNCGKQETSTAILGCYNGQNIYIYNVTDARLNGIKETTAAHEMLHVAYARLSDGEKQSVDTMLEAEYNKLKDNKDFAERMSFYARTEPGQRDNELHSVIGTEVGLLSPDLEHYYSKYFADRSKVVAEHDQYASVFAQLQAQSDTLSAQLTQLGNTIQQQTQDYNAAVTALNSDITSFNQQANSGGFTSKEAFDTERASLVARANSLDSLRQQINTEIAQYNTLRDQLANVASQSEALNQSINSSLAPAPSL
jgi:chaperonin cofactor prefoldin